MNSFHDIFTWPILCTRNGGVKWTSNMKNFHCKVQHVRAILTDTMCKKHIQKPWGQTIKSMQQFPPCQSAFSRLAYQFSTLRIFSELHNDLRDIYLYFYNLLSLYHWQQNTGRVPHMATMVLGINTPKAPSWEILALRQTNKRYRWYLYPLVMTNIAIENGHL